MQNETTKKQINYANVIRIMKEVGNYVLILLAVASGFFLGRVSNDILPKPQAKSTVKRATEISVAINESNQMLIIDKKTGKYDMFADSVGLTIFRMYAGKIFQQQAGK